MSSSASDSSASPPREHGRDNQIDRLTEGRESEEKEKEREGEGHDGDFYIRSFSGGPGRFTELELRLSSSAPGAGGRLRYANLSGGMIRREGEADR